MFKKLITPFIAMCFGASATFAQDAIVVTPEEKEKIRAALIEIFEENPEIVIFAIQEFQERQQAARMLPKIENYRQYLEQNADAPVLGNPNGDVTIVEFFDYRCGYCRRHFPAVMDLIEKDGNIRFLPKQFPILDRPDQPAVSRMASLAALSAHKQGKFAEFHTALMSEPAGLTEDRIYDVAGRIGLDVDKLKADMKDKLLEKRIQNSLAIGQDIGFSATPAYIIGDSVIIGAKGFETMQKAVEKARKKAASGQ